MTPALRTRLRSVSGANSGHFEACLSIREIRQIVAALDGNEATISRLSDALEALLTRHATLVDSGDCGPMDVESEPEMIEARAALDVLSPPAEAALCPPQDAP